MSEALDALKNKTTPPTEEAKKEYQSYSSARISTSLVTPTGKRINFTNYAYYTNDEEIISFLNREIKLGCPAITKGDRLSADEINPAAAEKRRIIEEFKVSQEGRDFSGEFAMEERIKRGKVSGSGTGTLTTSGVAN